MKIFTSQKASTTLFTGTFLVTQKYILCTIYLAFHFRNIKLIGDNIDKYRHFRVYLLSRNLRQSVKEVIRIYLGLSLRERSPPV